ncbi:hypothetical protein I3843_09G062200 [Carya illinoinensis]|nr:hypothetical protein I3843_09G062200 [Carya illinoinensis]
MALPDMVEFARSLAVMVRVQGPDPKGLKMRNHAFHQYNSGKTTLSASGMLLPDNLYDAEVAKRLCSYNDRCPVLVVTVASIVDPFLSLQHRENIAQGQPKLIPGVQIDIMVEGKMGSEKGSKDLDKGAPCWIPAQVLTLADIPASALALQSITEASLGSLDNGWEVGWSLASQNSGPQPFMDATQTRNHLAVGGSDNLNLIGKSTTRIAILGVSLSPEDVPNIIISSLNKRGDFLLSVGSPFGVLSPMHFFNRSLLMADIRGLPGMEGGPVFDEHADLIGILIKPLRQKASSAEVQLVIPWEAIAAACSELLQKVPPNGEKRICYSNGNSSAVRKIFITNGEDLDGSSGQVHKHLNSHYPSQLPVEKAMTAICLVTIDDGVWASGILLNNQGLILTNAHLLEPLRFGKTTVGSATCGTKSEKFSFLSEESASLQQNRVKGNDKNQSFLPNLLGTVNHSVDDEHEGYKLSESYGGRRKIRIRLDHTKPWVWCDARVVYVCKGPLDVALLQLDDVPDQLSPIIMDFECPSLGSRAYVLGHGLFGPRCGFFPSVCSGVVTKVVQAKIPSYPFNQEGNTQGHYPVMLETTAAVHPGGSGGAVVNSDGHMIGLVTSNARHSGGTVIPHLNFSIPCAALEPIFNFSKDMQDRSLLQVLDQPNEHLSSVWALMPSLSPKPPPLPNLPKTLGEDNDKEGKGSRFAKFMAEREGLLKKPFQLGKVERLSNVIIPSKL